MNIFFTTDGLGDKKFSVEAFQQVSKINSQKFTWFLTFYIWKDQKFFSIEEKLWKTS